MNFAEECRKNSMLLAIIEILLLPVMIMTAGFTFNSYIDAGRFDYILCMAGMCIEFIVLVFIEYVAKEDRAVSKKRLIGRTIMRTAFLAVPLNIIAYIADKPMNFQSQIAMFFGMVYAFVLITPMFFMTIAYMSKYVKKSLTVMQCIAFLTTAVCAIYIYFERIIRIFS